MAFNLKSQSPLKQAEDPYVASRLKAKANSGKKMSMEEYGDKHPIAKSIVQLVDPTGVTSYGDVSKAWNDGKLDSSDIIEPLGALPVIGKFGKLIKGAKIGSDYVKASKLSKALGVANKLGDIATAVNTPLKQRLSPTAAKAKAVRDLAYAKTPDRRDKKADSQRKHRQNPGSNGKDYDHKDGKFKSVKDNRGNGGEGTKKEGKSNYKITR